MDPLMTSAASGLRSRMEALELLANNLANAGTTGYKSDREFYALYAAPESDGNSVLPNIERRWTDFTQGTIAPTGSQLDLAISGKGFFAVDGPNGTLYTRNGSLRVNNGRLTTAEGYALRGVDGGPILVDGARPFDVTPDGTVKQGGIEMGRVALVDFASPQNLEKLGRTYFRSAETPTASTAEIRQGRIEASNVGVAESAVHMVGILRQFEMLQKAVTLGGEMGRRAVDEVAKATP